MPRTAFRRTAVVLVLGTLLTVVMPVYAAPRQKNTLVGDKVLPIT
jgi:hypothetical protein